MKKDSHLIFALVGAVGAELGRAADAIERELKSYGYKVNRIRLTELLCEIEKYKHLKKLSNGKEDKRISEFMDAGNDFRKTYQAGEAVAALAIPNIKSNRLYCRKKCLSTAHIIISFKNPDEVGVFRKIYGDAFFLVGAYSPENARTTHLAKKIAKSHGKYDGGEYINSARKLIDRDRKENWTKRGQNVEDTFARSDVFIDVSHTDETDVQIARFIRLILGYPFHTPTHDEYGIFLAEAVSRRSADLSRQVGAVITSGAGDILTAGCNEVPKSGGGAVWEDFSLTSENDNRDFRLGYDSTSRLKYDIVEELITRLKNKGWLAEDKTNKTPRILSDELLYNESKDILRGTRLTSILEFGRVVHAEMHALTNAARRGISVEAGSLYSTTFPCHMCARHIIASGIKRVVYIQPYPKSLAKELHQDAIRVEDDGPCPEKAVVFQPFVGVAPRRYMDLFQAPQRKDDKGHALTWASEDARAKFFMPANVDDLEASMLAIIGDAEGVRR